MIFIFVIKIGKIIISLFRKIVTKGSQLQTSSNICEENVADMWSKNEIISSEI